jgi:spore coat polysaccharide biosynthesis predicted glycosyltransferase SpsG
MAGWQRAPQTVVVLGPVFGNGDEVVAATQGRPAMTVVRSPDDFMGLLAGQDVVITSAGRTLYECAALGKPVITVPTIAHEAVTAAEFSRLTGSPDIGQWDTVSGPARLLAAMETYWRSPRLRHGVGQAGCQLVDGMGLQRVVSVLEKSARRLHGSGSAAGPEGCWQP